MGKYPIFLELKGRRVVVIGAGAVAGRKAETLLQAGARVVVVADRIDDKMKAVCKGRDVELIESKYSKFYLSGALLVIAATDDNELNKEVYRDCQEQEILCNVVDDPELCDFFVPAVVKRGELQIAIGTEGQCPAYSGHLQEKLEEIFTEKHGEFLAELKTIREKVLREVKEAADRKSILGRLVGDESYEYFVRNGAGKWRQFAERLVTQGG